MNIKETLSYGINYLNEKKIEDSFIIANVLLQKVVNQNKTQLIINAENEVSPEDNVKYMVYLEKIISGLPLQYITNKQSFYGLDFYVDENVLIPQPDTEILVEKVIDLCEKKSFVEILDMCTGSGCIGISLKKNLKNAEVTLSDISISALEIAKKNSNQNNVNVEFINSDMFSKIEKKYDVIVSNPPYIKKSVISSLSIEVKNEPHIALDGGEDGVDFYRIFANEAYKYLNENGILALEIGFDQKEEVIDILKKAKKYKNIKCIKDLSENDRVIICSN